MNGNNVKLCSLSLSGDDDVNKVPFLAVNEWTGLENYTRGISGTFPIHYFDHPKFSSPLAACSQRLFLLLNLLDMLQVLSSQSTPLSTIR